MVIQENIFILCTQELDRLTKSDEKYFDLIYYYFVYERC